MFTYPFSKEIGAGDIPKEVQRALWREINFRLGEGDVKSPLSRLEKSLVLTRMSGNLLNSMRTHLYILQALKAGATLNQVAEAAISVTMAGMLRWKMAASDALYCAEAWAKQNNLLPLTPPIIEKDVAERIDKKIRGYFRKSHSSEFPEMWEQLLEVAPSVLDGYMQMRMAIVRSGSAIPKHIKELLIIGGDIVQGNAWGAKNHARQAIRDGATLGQLVDTIALAMLEIGQSAYRIGGMDAIRSAKEAVKKRKDR